MLVAHMANYKNFNFIFLVSISSFYNNYKEMKKWGGITHLLAFPKYQIEWVLFFVHHSLTLNFQESNLLNFIIHVCIETVSDLYLLKENKWLIMKYLICYGKWSKNIMVDNFELSFKYKGNDSLTIRTLYQIYNSWLFLKHNSFLLR